MESIQFSNDEYKSYDGTFQQNQIKNPETL